MKQKITRCLRRFTAADSGATAIEYALLATLMAIALVATLFNYGNEMTKMFNIVSNRVDAAHSGN